MRRGKKRRKKDRKKRRKVPKAAWVEIATLIAPILWLWRQNAQTAISSLQQLSADQLKCP